MQNSYFSIFSVFIAIFFLLSEVQTVHTTNVTLLICSSGFDSDHMCKKVESRGANLDVTINTSTKNALTSMPENRALDLIFDECAAADSDNWHCWQKMSNDSPLTIGMTQGRFFMKGAWNASSISGWKYWALRLHLIDFNAAANGLEQGRIFGINTRALESFPLLIIKIIIPFICMGIIVGYLDHIIAKKFPKMLSFDRKALTTLIITIVASVIFVVIWLCLADLGVAL